jgi:cell division protein FtsB
MDMKDQFIKRSDENPGAILNTDTEGLKQYKKLKNSRRILEDEINILKEELRMIKEMLTK